MADEQDTPDSSAGNILTDAFGTAFDFIAGDEGLLSSMGDPNNPVGQLLNLGVASYLSDSMQANRPEVGYQGKIPNYSAVRKRVQQPADSTEGRRTGILSATPFTRATMEDMEFDDAMFADMGDEEVAAKKQQMLDAENIKRRAKADAESVRQGDMYAQGEERRPGGKGKRYFSDTIYAQRPEDTEVPTLAEAEAQANEQAASLSTVQAATGGHLRKYAQGGIAGAHKGYYLGGKTDGMADKVPARIDGKQEARLSDGEFVIPADVVSHLGNGNSDAGADQLHSMMNNVRTARTGNPDQGKQINPQNFMPKMAQGGLAQYADGGSVYKRQPVKTNFEDGGAAASGSYDAQEETPVGQEVGTSGALANWAGDYVSEMLGQGKALGNQDYEAYAGPLTAGASELQGQAFTGISALNNPMSPDSVVNQMGAFTPDAATLDPFMNPYTDNVINRTAADMRRQSQIDALGDRTAMTNAGAFGGSRDALLRAERSSNLSRNIGDMSAEQRAAGFGQAMDRAKAAQEMTNQYGMDVLSAQTTAGQTQRGIASEGIAADYEQFREERDYPYKQVQYMQSLLQGLPVAAQSTSYTTPSALGELQQGQAGLQYLLDMFGYQQTPEDINTEETT